jgi:hypothetical protein
VVQLLLVELRVQLQPTRVQLPILAGGIRSTIAEKAGIQDLAPKIAQRGQLAADAVNSAKTAENAAHAEASAPYKALAAKIQETIPPEKIRGDVGDIVHGVIEDDKIPGAIKDMMDAGTAKRSTGPSVSGRHFKVQL